MNHPDWGPWTPAEYPPSRPGHYLVAQRLGNKKYHWVRYWTGTEWSNIGLEKYGEVYAWVELLPFP